MGMSASQMRLLSLTARMSDLEYQGQQISNDRERLSVQSSQVAQDYTDALNKIQLKMSVTDASGNSSTKAMTANVLLQCGLNYTNSQYFLMDNAGRVLITSDMAKNYSSSFTTGADGKKSANLETFLNEYGVTSDTSKTADTDTYKYDKSSVQYYTNLFDKIGKNGYITADDNLGNSDWLSDQLQNGNLTLAKYSATATDDDGNKGIFQDEDWSTDTSITQTDDDVAIEKAKAEYDSKSSKIETQDKNFELSQKNIDTEHSAIQTEYDAVKKVIDKNVERSFKTFNS